MLNAMEQEYCLNSWKKPDYDALRRDCLPLLAEAEKTGDRTAYARILTEAGCRFYDSHVGAELPYQTESDVCDVLAARDYGFSMIRLDDGSVIAVLTEPDNAPGQSGIHDGTVILSWDGREINEAIAQTECIYPGCAFAVKSNEVVYRPAFLAAMGGDSVTVTFLDDSGKEQTAVLPDLGYGCGRLESFCSALDYQAEVLANQTNDFSIHSARMLDSQCGCLGIRKEHYETVSDHIALVRDGYDPKLTEFYAGQIEALKAQGMQYLVIDIRNNSGGFNCCAGALVSLFTDQKKLLSSFGYEDRNGYHNKMDEYIFPDGRYKDLPAVVLVNQKCMSAGDALAKYLGACENVTLMGYTASSGVNQNIGGYIYLPNGICMRYPVNLSLSEEGVPLIDTDETRENRIPLEAVIPMTEERALQLFNYRKVLDFNFDDTELEYAVRYLEQNSIPE